MATVKLKITRVYILSVRANGDSIELGSAFMELWQPQPGDYLVITPDGKKHIKKSDDHIPDWREPITDDMAKQFYADRPYYGTAA